MGISFFKSCGTNYDAPAPNPDPSRWHLIQLYQYDAAYVIVVKYDDCTNFEGIKVMVYRGVYKHKSGRLDPHFDEKNKNSPIARFRPDDEGLDFAIAMARSLLPKAGAR